MGTVNFNGLTLGPVPRMWSLVSSVAGHAVVLVLLAVVSQHVSAWLKDDQVDWARYKVEPLRLHLNEPLFFRAASAPEPLRPLQHLGTGAFRDRRRRARPRTLARAPKLLRPRLA